MKIPCRFAESGCTSPAVAIYYVPRGCHCWSDPIQALCRQHEITIESPGPITRIVAVDEQEQCAKECDKIADIAMPAMQQRMPGRHRGLGTKSPEVELGALRCAAAIRGRKKARPARDGIEAQRGLNDTWPGDQIR